METLKEFVAFILLIKLNLFQFPLSSMKDKLEFSIKTDTWVNNDTNE